MLIGNVVHGVDPKGRVFIPVKWREDLGPNVVLTHGILGQGDARCLFAMSVEAFREFSKPFTTLPVTDLPGQRVRRMLFSSTTECEMDKQGRILLTAALREHAGIDKEAALVGMDTRIELWDPEALRKHNASSYDNFNASLAELAKMGI